MAFVLEPSVVWAEQASVGDAQRQTTKNGAPIPFDFPAAQGLWQPQQNHETYYFYPYSEQQPDKGSDAFLGISSGLWVAIFTLALVLATFVQAILILRAEALTRRSLKLSLRQGVRAKIDNMKRSAETAKTLEIGDRNANAAVDAAKAMRKIANEAQQAAFRATIEARQRQRDNWHAMNTAAEANEIAREIGQAQVRAYVSIPSVSTEFLDDLLPGQYHPKITIVARNDGATPAKEYVWNPTIIYISGDVRKEQRLLETFQDSIGMMIPAKDQRGDDVLITGMDIEGFAGSCNPRPASVLVRVRIEFRFKDIFDKTIEDAAYFSGNFYKLERDKGSVFVIGGPDWRADQFTAMPRDWGDSKPSGESEA